jgi:hypothetical protein
MSFENEIWAVSWPPIASDKRSTSLTELFRKRTYSSRMKAYRVYFKVEPKNETTKDCFSLQLRQEKNKMKTYFVPIFSKFLKIQSDLNSIHLSRS